MLRHRQSRHKAHACDHGFLHKKSHSSLRTFVHYQETTSDPDFVQTVIGWTLTVLKKEQLVDDITVLTSQCSSSTYLNRYIPLVLQDARGVIASGLDKANKRINLPFRLKLVYDVTEPKDRNNPWILKFKGSIASKDDESGFTMNVLRMRSENFNFIGIASEDRDNHEVTVKAKVYHKGFVADRKGLFAAGAKWEATYIGSLVTHERMFDVCHSQTIRSRLPMTLLNKIASGSIAASAGLTVGVAGITSFDNNSSLNHSQQTAITSFLTMPAGGNIMLLQGPPGTGKTTTVAELLKQCYARGQRTLVCAPSNKAVQVLATRFLQKNPTSLIVVTGVSDKMTSELKPIFLSHVVTTVADLRWSTGEAFDVTQKDEETAAKFAARQHKDFQKNHGQLMALCGESLLRYQFVSRSQLDALERNWVVLDKLLAARTQSALAIVDEPHSPKSKIPRSSTLQMQLLTYRRAVNDILDQFKSPDPKIKDAEHASLLILNKCPVIFSTLSNSGSFISSKMNRVDNLVVDEAGQSVEAETLIAFQHAPSKVMLVGDTKQLPATVISTLAVNYHYDWSMMSRLSDHCNQACALLDTQYRMHRDICAFPSAQYYQDRLITQYTPRAAEHLNVTHAFHRPLYFYNLGSKKGQSNETTSGNSKQNATEAKYVADIVAKTRETDKHSTIGVITFYSAQRDLLNRVITKKDRVQISTVDGFQGDECDIIIISFVRDNHSNQVGFVADERRINVAITRAKHMLICLGSSEVLRKGSTEIGHFVNNVMGRNLLLNEAHLRVTLGQEGATHVAAPTAATKQNKIKNAGKKKGETVANPIEVVIGKVASLTLAEDATQKGPNNGNAVVMPGVLKTAHTTRRPATAPEHKTKPDGGNSGIDKKTDERTVRTKSAETKKMGKPQQVFTAQSAAGR